MSQEERSPHRGVADPPNMGYNPTIGYAGAPTYLQGEPIYLANALDETFHKSDFIYGPQTTRPGPGGAALSAGTLPLYHGQNMGDTSTAEYLFFVDLKAGNVKPSTYNSVVPGGLLDNGAVKVHYSFTGLDTVATFNAYGWVASANQGEGISFANSTTGASNDSGFVLTYTGP